MRAALAALTALLLAQAAPAIAQDVVQRPQGNVTTPGVPSGLPTGAAPTSPDLPDERPLWRLLAAGEDATLEARIARLRTAYPAWIPPAQMLALLGQRRDEQSLTQAKAQRDWATVRRLAATHPEMATCSRPDDAAAAAASPGAPSTLAQVYAGCVDDASRAALLGAALDRFGPAAAAPVLDRLGEAALPEALRTRLSDLRTDAALQRLGHALEDGAADALAQGDALRPAIEARRDGGTATALGWAALKVGRPRDAIAWFETGRRLDPTQPGEGLARAYAAAGDATAAQQLLAATPGPQATALAGELATAQIDAAYRRGAYAEVVAQATPLPDPPIVLGWSLFRLRRFDAAATAFERRYRAHHETAAAEGLVLSLTEAGRPDAAEAAAARYGGAVQAALAIAPTPGGPDLGYRLAVGRLRAALDRHDAAAVARLAQTLAAPVQARQDFAVATTLGFAAFDQNRMDDAARWFALGAQAPTPAVRDDAQYGAALTAFRQGDAAKAEAIAASHPADGRWGQLRRDALMLQAQQASATNPDDPDALALAREVLRLDPERRDAAMLLAWSDLRAGRRAEAAAAFEHLYRATPDAAAANGLTNAATPAQGQTLAAELGGPLRPAIQARAAQDAFARKAFLAAYRIDPGLDPALANLDAPSFSLDAASRSKSGSAGTSRLTSETGDLAGTISRDLDRITVRVHFVSLDAGTAPPATGPTVARMTTRLALGAEPVIAWERQTPLSPIAELGLTPIGGVLAPTVQGQAGISWQGTAASGRAALYRQSITESVLSFTGIVDPTSGRHFGRVMETGGKLEGYLPLAPRWGVYGQAALGLRDGVDVRSNLHGAAATTLSYDLHPPGFDYLTLGPSYQFSAFQHDLSGFTPGQGGYYSPSTSHTAAAALRFQTAEAREIIVRGSLSAGWQFARSAGTGSATGGAGPSRQDGFNSVGEVVASYRLTPRWAIGGQLRYQVSPQYTDLYGGIALTFSLGDRTRLLSADLPHFDSR